MLFDAVLLYTHAVVLYLVKTVFRLQSSAFGSSAGYSHSMVLVLSSLSEDNGGDDDSSLCFKNYDDGFHPYFLLELLSEGKCLFGSGRKNANDFSLISGVKDRLIFL